MTRKYAGMGWVVASIVALVPVQAFSADPLGTVPDKIFVNGFESYLLTVNNYLAWCSVTVNGGAASSASVISEQFSEGKVVPLHADPAQGFIWGYWTGTDAGGTDHSQDATVTMSADSSVLACCPFASSPTCP